MALPRERAVASLADGRAAALHLNAATLDIDHCLPWSAWSYGDLWNLLPAHRLVSQHAKCDRLPGDGLLRGAAEPIQHM